MRSGRAFSRSARWSVLAAALSGCATAPYSTDAQDESAIRSALAATTADYNACRSDEFFSHFAPDATVYLPSSTLDVTRRHDRAVRDADRDFCASGALHEDETEFAQISIWGDTALAVGRARYRETAPDGTVRFESDPYLITYILTREVDGWSIRHTQVSLPLPAETTEPGGN